MSLAAVVALLQAVLSLLMLVQANPSLPQSMRDNAVLVAQSVITQATAQISAGVPNGGIVSIPQSSTTQNSSAPTVASSTGPIITVSPNAPNGDIPSQFPLQAGQYIDSKNLRLLMQTDGNFVIYDMSTNPATPLWGSNTAGRDCTNRCHAAFENGNIVLYQDATVYWRTYASPGSTNQIALRQTSPYLEIVNNGTLVWPTTPLAVLSGRDPAVYPVDIGGCNTTSFAQVPGQQNLFIGRRPTNATPPNCPPADSPDISALSLYQFDWSTKKFTYVRDVYLPSNTKYWPDTTKIGDPVNDGAYRIYSAYDATIESINGELWIAFECAVVGAETSSCMAPLDSNFAAIKSRMNVVISGKSTAPNDPYINGAGVPELFQFGGKTYLYWNLVRVAPGTGQWVSITTRGIELAQQLSNAGVLFWPKGFTRAVAANDVSNTIEVFGLDPSDTSKNGSAATTGVFTDATYIYSLGGTGGSGCFKSGGGAAPSCYQFTISRSTAPLGYHAFDQHALPSSELPANSQDYVRRSTDPSGNAILLGHYYNALDPSVASTNVFQSGEYAYAVPNDFGILQFEDHPQFPTLVSRNCDLATLGGGKDMIAYLYCLVYGRAPDDSGRTTYTNAFANGYTVFQFLDTAYSSQEFSNLYGPDSLDNYTYINLAYQILLHRLPDSAGADHYAALLQQGYTRAQVWQDIYGSPEFAAVNSILFRNSIK